MCRLLLRSVFTILPKRVDSISAFIVLFELKMLGSLEWLMFWLRKCSQACDICTTHSLKSWTEADRSHEKHMIDRANTTWNIDLRKKY